MHSHNLEMLRREYANATTPDDILIQMELDNIIRLNHACKGEEFKLATAIIDKFCQIIQRMKEQQELPVQAQEFPFGSGMPQSRFLTADDIPSAPDEWDDCPYASDEELLVDFYNSLCNAQKKNTEKEPARYEKISFLEELKMVNANPTIRDYVARIKTFARLYLLDMFEPEEVGDQDRVLFTYQKLEMILARFDTSDSKQKVNIRSALRKLNSFKQKYTHR